MSAHRTTSLAHRSDSHYRASVGSSKHSTGTFITDNLTYHTTHGALLTSADKNVANYASLAIFRSKYDLDCFYPTDLQLRTIINALMPMAVKYSRVAYPGGPAPRETQPKIEWNATTIPTPPAVVNAVIHDI